MSRTISGSYSSGITLSSGDNPVSVTGSIAVTTVADALYGPAGTGWTISNSGYIGSTNTASPTSIYAVALDSSTGGSVVTNQTGGTIIGGGGPASPDQTTAPSGLVGAGISLTGSLYNLGTIAGEQGGIPSSNQGEAGTYQHGGGGGDGAVLADGALSNSSTGTIVGGQGGGFGGYATYGGAGGAGVMLAGGSLTNSGVISGGAGGVGGNNYGYQPGGNGGSGGDAITLLGTGVVLNDNSITGGSGGSGGAGRGIGGNGGGGVALAQGGTLRNYAVITGGAGGSGGTPSGTAGFGVYVGPGASLINYSAGTISAGTGGSGGIGASLASSGALSNDGTITGGADGVYASGGGSVTNNASAAITARAGDAVDFSGASGTVINYGTVAGTGGIFASDGGSVTNNASAAITASAGDAVNVNGASGTVINYGTVAGTGGIYETAGGSVTNDAVITASSFSGVYTRYGGQVANNTGGTIIGGNYAVFMYEGAGQVFNQGTLQGGSTRAGAVLLVNGGSVANLESGAMVGGVELAGGASYLTNSAGGTIRADGTIPSVFIHGVPGTVVNSGVILSLSNDGVDVSDGTGFITNTATGAITGTSNGVILAYGTVANAGTIVAATGPSDNAVEFQVPEPTNLLIDDPGAVFTGNIYGGQGELELASAASRGTVSGLGDTITNFSSLAFDHNAHWTVSGDEAGLGTLGIGGFNVGDTIDLTGFYAIGRTFTNNALVLTDSGNNAVTLNIQGNFNTGSFRIPSDGAGGTNIYLAPAGTYTWNNTGTADWNTPSYWSPAAVPSPADNALIENSGSNLVTIASGESVGINGLTLGNSDTLQVNGTLTANTIADNAVLAFTGNQSLDATPLSLNGTIAEQDANTLTLGSGEVITQSGTSATLGGLSGATIINDGTINAAESGGSVLIGPIADFTNNGAIEVSNRDTLNVTSVSNDGTGAIDIGANGIANFASTVASSQTVSFTATTGELVVQQPSSFAATILGFGEGNTIDLAGISADSASWLAGQLNVSNNGTQVASLSLSGDYSTDTFSIADDGAGGSAITITATCYASGTRILTPRGEVAVEHLHEGDLVLTVSGQAQPVVWIGHRRVDFRHHPNRQRVLPVRVSAHAFGDGQPRRDLLLSPDHAVFVNDVLIPIRQLVNGSTIEQLDRRSITYWHIELPRHDVLLADGLPAESYLDAGARSAFANYDGAVQLHPDFASPREDWALLWESKGYAPMVVAGEILERTRHALARQAEILVGAAARNKAPRKRIATDMLWRAQACRPRL